MSADGTTKAEKVVDLTCCKECRANKPIILVTAECGNCNSSMAAEWTKGQLWREKKICPKCGCKTVRAVAWLSE